MIDLINERLIEVITNSRKQVQKLLDLDLSLISSNASNTDDPFQQSGKYIE